MAESSASGMSLRIATIKPKISSISYFFKLYSIGLPLTWNAGAKKKQIMGQIIKLFIWAQTMYVLHHK